MTTQPLTLRRLEESDIPFLDQFFERLIPKAYRDNEVDARWDDEMLDELAKKKSCIREDAASQGKNRCFLLACNPEGRIVGTISYGEANELMNECSEGATEGMLELAGLMVEPEYRLHGTAMILFEGILKLLDQEGVQQIGLDCGYKHAQRMWVKKLGAPHYCFENYWDDNGGHNMVWILSVQDTLARLFP